MSRLRTNISISVILLIMPFYVCCGGGSGTDDPLEPPTNLQIDYELIGADNTSPYGDGSGQIRLTFSANNATSYKVNMGDGEIIETQSTVLEYTYKSAGLKNYTVYVSAYNEELFISKSIQITIKINSALRWSDEFNGSGAPNTANWTHEIGGHGWGNGESQYYTNRLDNAKVEDGFLIITAKKENYEGSAYTSARLISKDKFEFKYGRVDIRAKLPEGVGTWPALWMLGANIDDVGWPACGEIDIMEHWGHNATHVSSATHTTACSSLNCDKMMVGSTTINDYATAFHVYSLEWSENELRFLIDDNYLYSYNPNPKTSDNWPFDKPHFFILNVAMGGHWFTIDPNFTKSTTEIDYIRVYQ